jgi:hypothetical protein
MVVSFLALSVALSGTAYAVGKLPARSVGTKQLKAGAVTSSKVKDGSLRAQDFAAGQVPSGPQGPVGPEGPRGPTGSSGTSQSAGAWASRFPSYLIPALTNDRYVEMFSLSQFADSSTGKLRLSKPSRLVLNGHVALGPVDPVAVVRCRFEVHGAQGWSRAGLTGYLVDYDPRSVLLMHLTAVIDVDASADDVRIVCRPEDSTTEVKFEQGAFTVVVADR